MKWIGSSATFAERLVAFAAVEVSRLDSSAREYYTKHVMISKCQTQITDDDYDDDGSDGRGESLPAGLGRSWRFEEGGHSRTFRSPDVLAVRNS